MSDQLDIAGVGTAAFAELLKFAPDTALEVPLPGCKVPLKALA